MRAKNTSGGIFNLLSGTLKPGETGEVTYEEAKVLFSSNKAEPVVESTKAKHVVESTKAKPVAKPVAKLVAKKMSAKRG